MGEDIWQEATKRKCKLNSKWEDVEEEDHEVPPKKLTNSNEESSDEEQLPRNWSAAQKKVEELQRELKGDHGKQILHAMRELPAVVATLKEIIDKITVQISTPASTWSSPTSSVDGPVSAPTSPQVLSDTDDMVPLTPGCDVKVPRLKLNYLRTASSALYIGDLAVLIYGKDTLSNSSLTGKQSGTHKDVESKQPLDNTKLDAILAHAQAKFPDTTMQDVRRIIRQKCNNISYVKKVCENSLQRWCVSLPLLFSGMQYGRHNTEPNNTPLLLLPFPLVFPGGLGEESLLACYPATVRRRPVSTGKAVLCALGRTSQKGITLLKHVQRINIEVYENSLQRRCVSLPLLFSGEPIWPPGHGAQQYPSPPSSLSPSLSLGSEGLTVACSEESLLSGDPAFVRRKSTSTGKAVLCALSRTSPPPALVNNFLFPVAPSALSTTTTCVEGITLLNHVQRINIEAQECIEMHNDNTHNNDTSSDANMAGTGEDLVVYGPADWSVIGLDLKDKERELNIRNKIDRIAAKEREAKEDGNVKQAKKQKQLKEKQEEKLARLLEARKIEHKTRQEKRRKDQEEKEKLALEENTQQKEPVVVVRDMERKRQEKGEQREMKRWRRALRRVCSVFTSCWGNRKEERDEEQD
ncbi:hypothetical protein ACEWY4_000366 [Coilia grayii]|uniref:BEN domain-containing protein n=1 Tax=Coilia grayii TaxID=363190 RepID=A0ABD1KWG7_9TELE